MSRTPLNHAFIQEAEELIANGQHGEARKLIEVHLESHPESADGFFAQALLGHALGRVDLTMQSYTKAVSLAKDRDEAAYFRKIFNRLPSSQPLARSADERPVDFMHGKLKRTS